MSKYKDYWHPLVDMERKPSKSCDGCGIDIYFLQQNTAKRGLHWVAYQEAGNGGGGYKELKLHRCQK